MNFLAKCLTNVAKTCLRNSIEGVTSGMTKLNISQNVPGSFLGLAGLRGSNILQGFEQQRFSSSLWKMHKTGPHKKNRPNKNPLGYNVPFAKGVVLKTLIKKPKKPNSANRKCVLVKLSSGKEMVAYIPGIGHNLQEHNIVLVRVGRCKDVPGVKIKCVRGKYDLAHVVKRTQ